MTQSKVTAYDHDAEGHWVAILACGHTRHLRHKPPWEMRPWVLTEQGRANFLGTELSCSKCEPTTITTDPLP